MSALGGRSEIDCLYVEHDLCTLSIFESRVLARIEIGEKIYCYD